MTEPIGRSGGSTRRQFVVGGVGALTSASFLLAACGGEDEAEPGASRPGGGPWSYVDGRGVEISLPARPERLVMDEDAAAYLMPFGVRPLGIWGTVPLGEQPTHDDLDLSGIESLGEVFGEVNLEAMAGLRPDLIVCSYSPSTQGEGADMYFGSDRLLERAERIAPAAGVLAFDSVAAIIERFKEFAALLGADVTVQKKAQERYEAAIADLKAALEENPDVAVTAVSSTPENLYVAKPEDFPDLTDFVAWGVGFSEVTGAASYFDTLSWENADKYPADLILYDARPGTPSPEDIASRQPTWASLPAVEADQVAPWHTEEHSTYDRYAGHIEELAAAIRGADAGLAT